MGDIFGSREGCLVVLLSLISLSLNKEGFNWTSGPLAANLFEVFKIEYSHHKGIQRCYEKVVYFISKLFLKVPLWSFVFQTFSLAECHNLHLLHRLHNPLHTTHCFLEVSPERAPSGHQAWSIHLSGRVWFPKFIRFSVNITDKKKLVSVPKLTL